MGIRRLARQRAIQLLYSLEYSRAGFEESESDFLRADSKRRKGWGDFGRRLARSAHEHEAELDEEISGALVNWTLQRLATMDRLCLRMALAEMKYFPEIPLRSTINEYIELARMFGTDDSPKYVNGVLDRLAQSYRHKDFGAAEEEEETDDEETDEAPTAAKDVQAEAEGS